MEDKRILKSGTALKQTQLKEIYNVVSHHNITKLKLMSLK